jgi:hypothetical protein
MANTLTLISSSTLGTAASSFTFSSVPQTYDMLLVKWSTRCSATNGGYQVYSVFGSFNGSNISANTGLAGAGSVFAYTGPTYQIGWMPDAAAPANMFGISEMKIPNYASTTTYKAIATETTCATTSSGVDYTGIVTSSWQSNSAITSVTLTSEAGNFVANSSFYLYGIKNS